MILSDSNANLVLIRISSFGDWVVEEGGSDGCFGGDGMMEAELSRLDPRDSFSWGLPPEIANKLINTADRMTSTASEVSTMSEPPTAVQLIPVSFRVSTPCSSSCSDFTRWRPVWWQAVFCLVMRKPLKQWGSMERLLLLTMMRWLGRWEPGQ